MSEVPSSKLSRTTATMSGPLAALVDGRLLHDPQFNAKSRQWRAPIDARRQVSAALPFKRELPHARDRCGERNEVKWGFACCGIRGQCSPLPENPGGENTLARQSPPARGCRSGER